MNGVITSKDVVGNLGLILREFGVLCVLRCCWALVSGRETTFLECVFSNPSR